MCDFVTLRAKTARNYPPEELNTGGLRGRTSTGREHRLTDVLSGHCRPGDPLDDGFGTMIEPWEGVDENT